MALQVQVDNVMRSFLELVGLCYKTRREAP